MAAEEAGRDRQPPRCLVSPSVSLSDEYGVDVFFLFSFFFANSGRKYSEFFMELVPREEYPDYYALIKRPMSFDIVQVRRRRNYLLELFPFLNSTLIFSRAS
jgi:hypothetical protein